MFVYHDAVCFLQYLYITYPKFSGTLYFYEVTEEQLSDILECNKSSYHGLPVLKEYKSPFPSFSPSYLWRCKEVNDWVV